MIKLNHLELKNFLSHVNTSLSLDEYEGLILIEGKNKSGYYSSNGSGKSTILEGIVYALTGSTLRGVAVNDVVNRNAGSDTKVSLSFSKDDVDYNISRYRKDTVHGDSLVFSKEGEDISKRVNKETQKSLDDTLGVSYDVLSSTVLLGEGLSSRFTQLSDPDKKSLIESTLNLNYDMSELKSKANKKLSDAKLESASIEGKISLLKELSNLNEDEVVAEIEKKTSTNIKLSSEIEEANQKISEMRKDRDSIMDKKVVLSSSLDKITMYLVELEKVDIEAVRYMNELQRLQTSSTPCCSLCNQALTTEESITIVQDSYRNKIEELHKRMIELTNTINSMPDREIIRQKLQSVEQEIVSLNTEILKLEELVRCNSDIVRTEEIAIKGLQDKLDQYHQSSLDISEYEEKLKINTRTIEKYDYFSKLFSPTGLVVDILSEAIDYINTRLGVYSAILLEKEYKLNFVKGKISLVDSKGSTYQSLSNGEKRRLDIAIQFSLHDYTHMYCGMKLDCCFIDEILDTLDDIGVENIVTVLRLKLEYCQLKSIYVITHNDSLKSKFDNVITVSKDDNGDSYIL